MGHVPNGQRSRRQSIKSNKYGWVLMADKPPLSVLVPSKGNNEDNNHQYLAFVQQSSRGGTNFGEPLVCPEDENWKGEGAMVRAKVWNENSNQSVVWCLVSEGASPPRGDRRRCIRRVWRRPYPARGSFRSWGTSMISNSCYQGGAGSDIPGNSPKGGVNKGFQNLVVSLKIYDIRN